MAIEIPNAELGAKFTNEITGVTYTYDGQKWVAEGGGGSHEHDEEYVNVEGDEMSGGLKVKYKADEGSMGLGVVRTSYEDTDYESRVQASILYAQNDGNTKFRVTNKGQVQAGHNSEQAFMAEQDHDLTTKKYVDLAAGSLFTAKYASNTGQLKDGDIWFQTDRIWLSWKTLSGRVWPVNPTVEDWKFWPEGAEPVGMSHTRTIPETYLVWESVEDGHPMGMVTVNKISWKTYVDENGELIGRPGYDTMALQLTYSSPSGFTTYPYYPPAGTILRVRFAPWL